MSNEINIPHTFSTLEGKGKRMETEVLLTEDLKLSLTTYHRTSGDKSLMTYATVSKRLKGHSDPFMYGHAIGYDYHRVFKVNKVRVTAKAVKEQHAEFLVNIANICAEVRKYYSVTILKGE
jgi:hypothetical protein